MAAVSGSTPSDSSRFCSSEAYAFRFSEPPPGIAKLAMDPTTFKKPYQYLSTFSLSLCAGSTFSLPILRSSALSLTASRCRSLSTLAASACSCVSFTRGLNSSGKSGAPAIPPSTPPARARMILIMFSRTSPTGLDAKSLSTSCPASNRVVPAFSRSRESTSASLIRENARPSVSPDFVSQLLSSTPGPFATKPSTIFRSLLVSPET